MAEATKIPRLYQLVHCGCYRGKRNYVWGVQTCKECDGREFRYVPYNGPWPENAKDKD